MKIIETDWKWSSGLSNRASTVYIALHHAECSVCTAADVDRWHKAKGWSGIGYHFFVRKDGSVYRGRPLDKMGAHVSGMNNCSIGICAEGAYMKEIMPYTQKKAIAELIDYLKSNYYPSAKIVGHKEIGSSDCPGVNYPLAELKNYKSVLGKESEELTLTQYEELKRLIERLQAQLAARDPIINQIGTELNQLKSDSEKTIYNYVDNNMPEWAKPVIVKLIQNGYLQGDENGELGLTKDLLRILVINDRAGMYQKKD